jgi:phosphatidate phosphatase PAH1
VTLLLVLLVLLAPAIADAQPPVTDTRCTKPPAVTVTGFRHRRSKYLARSGPNHRGIDVIAAEDNPVQHVQGKLAAGIDDQDLEDEEVEVFACIAPGSWKPIGKAITDDDGRFRFTLERPHRLPVGMRDLYVAALGDGSGAYFVGYNAPRGSSIVVTDVDGTISWSENSIIKNVVSRASDIKHRPNAPEAFGKLPYPIVYVTARGDVFMDVTRGWLERHGFPRGMLRLSVGLFARPGNKAIEYKTSVLKSLPVPIAAGIGNRKSDITAYSGIGLAAKRIFIHLPEYAKEVAVDLQAGTAIGFDDYAKLPKLLAP